MLHVPVGANRTWDVHIWNTIHEEACGDPYNSSRVLVGHD